MPNKAKPSNKPTPKPQGRLRPAVAPAAAKAKAKPKTKPAKPAKAGGAPPAEKSAPAPRLWVLAAYIACDQIVESGASRWDDPTAAMARLLVMRADGLAAEPTDETMRGARARPTSFVTWRAAAAKFRELAVDIPHKLLRKASKEAFIGAVSPYALQIATDPKHELYDKRGLLKPTAEMIANVDAVGVLDRVKFKQLREGGHDIDYVADGRQRLNTVREVNRHRLRVWWQKVLSAGRASAPPALIVEIGAEEVLLLKEAQRAGAVLNAPALRRDDTLQDQAARAPVLRAQGYSREEIGVQLGVSPGTVSNLLSLQQLVPELLEEMWRGPLPPGVAYLLAKEAADHQVELWTWVQRVPSSQRLAHLREILVAEGRVAELQAVVDGGSLSEGMLDIDRKNLAQAKEKLEKLKAGGGVTAKKPVGAKAVAKARERFARATGRGPAILRAALDFTLGVIDLEDVLKVTAQADEAVDPLLVECPDCCADPGDRCQDEEINAAWPNEIDTPHEARLVRAQRLRTTEAA